jgi:hypothetical protein
MKKLFFVFLFLTLSGAAFSQMPAQIIWRNGGKDGDVVTLKDAQNGVPLKAGKNAKTRSIYSENPNSGSVGIECSFPTNEIASMTKDGKLNFEVKWYYYMSTRKSLMGSNSVTIDDSAAQDGIVKFVCERNSICTGWWEVTIKNKNTGQMIRYANQDSYQICLN